MSVHPNVTKVQTKWKGTCLRCKRQVFLTRVGKETFKWVTDTANPKATWKCNPTANFPVRGHNPEQLTRGDDDE